MCIISIFHSSFYYFCALLTLHLFDTQFSLCYIIDTPKRERRIPVLIEKMKVLIADDEYMICELIKKMICLSLIHILLTGGRAGGRFVHKIVPGYRAPVPVPLGKFLP